MNLLKTTNCRAVRREIDESDLSPALTNESEAHLGRCTSCRDFRDQRIRLRQLVGSLEPVTAPADFDLRLRARIAAERQRPARGSLFPNFLLTTPVMAAATVIVMLAASIVWFTQYQRKRTSPVAQQNSPAALQPDAGAKLIAAAEENPNRANDDNPAKIGQPRDQAQNANRSNLSPDLNRNSGLLAKGKTSREFAVEPAEVIKQISDPPGQISLTAPDKPLVVSVEDNRGATHRFLLPPVSFGAQRLVDNRTPVSTSGSSKSW